MVNGRCTTGGLLGVALHLRSIGMLTAERLAHADVIRHRGWMRRHVASEDHRGRCERAGDAVRFEVHVERARCKVFEHADWLYTVCVTVWKTPKAPGDAHHTLCQTDSYRLGGQRAENRTLMQVNRG